MFRTKARPRTVTRLASACLIILALLFEQTQDLFKRWLLYGIGTMFAMAVLAVMVSIATEAVAISAAAMVAAYTLSTMPDLPVALGGGLSSAAVQQGGVGLIMSVLMVMAPPMAAMFFNGTLGQFAASSSFGTVGRNASGQNSDITQGTYKASGGSGRGERGKGQESG